MGIVAYAKALFGGGSQNIVTQAKSAGPLTPTQIDPAPGAFPWPMTGILGQQLLQPIMPFSGDIGAPVGRWGGNQYLGPESVAQPASNPAYYASRVGIRNIYGPGFASVPAQGPVPQTTINSASQPKITTPSIALNKAFTDYINSN